MINDQNCCNKGFEKKKLKRIVYHDPLSPSVWSACRCDRK